MRNSATLNLKHIHIWRVESWYTNESQWASCQMKVSGHFHAIFKKINFKFTNFNQSSNIMQINSMQYVGKLDKLCKANTKQSSQPVNETTVSMYSTSIFKTYTITNIKAIFTVNYRLKLIKTRLNVHISYIKSHWYRYSVE